MVLGQPFIEYIWNMFNVLRTLFEWVQYFLSLSIDFSKHGILNQLYNLVITIVNLIFSTDFPINIGSLSITDMLFGGGFMLVLVLTLFNWLVRVILAVVDAIT